MILNLKKREAKTKREMEKLLFKQIILFIEKMDKFEQQEMKKIRPIKSTWYVWFINYISEPIRKSLGGFKDKIVSLFPENKNKNIINLKE